MRRCSPMLAAMGLAIALVGCNGGVGGNEAKATTTLEASTTTSTLTREHEVLAALDRYWKVLARVYYELDSKGAEEVSAEGDLQSLLAEVARRQKAQQPMRYVLEHGYTLVESTPDQVTVGDRQVNHSLRLDPVTKQPVERDPNVSYSLTLTLKRLAGTWKVVRGVKKLEIAP